MPHTRTHKKMKVFLRKKKEVLQNTIEIINLYSQYFFQIFSSQTATALNFLRTLLFCMYYIFLAARMLSLKVEESNSDATTALPQPLEPITTSNNKQNLLQDIIPPSQVEKEQNILYTNIQAKCRFCTRCLFVYFVGS